MYIYIYKHHPHARGVPRSLTESELAALLGMEESEPVNVAHAGASKGNKCVHPGF